MRAAIITYAFPQKLNNEIMEALSGLQGVQVKLYKTAAEMKELENEGVLAVYLVSALAICEDFPWNSFDFVLDYDLNTTLQREELSRCSRLKEYITLKTVSKGLADNLAALDSNGKYTVIQSLKPTCQDPAISYGFLSKSAMPHLYKKENTKANVYNICSHVFSSCLYLDGFAAYPYHCAVSSNKCFNPSALK